MAWSEGHCFWCSTQEDADLDDLDAIAMDVPVIPGAGTGGNNLMVMSSSSRECHIVHRALVNMAVTGQDTTQAARSAVEMLCTAANAAVPPPHVLPN